MGALFDDSPQSFALLTSPKGGRLARFAASWEFGCWLATRTPGGRVKFLYHQDWTASFHAEYRDGEADLSSDDLTLGDSGPGVGSLTPLMSGPNASAFPGRSRTMDRRWRRAPRRGRRRLDVTPSCQPH